jgi:hypothetical protein
VADVREVFIVKVRRRIREAHYLHSNAYREIRDPNPETYYAEAGRFIPSTPRAANHDR